MSERVDIADSDRLDQMAENGELTPVEGTCIYRGMEAPAMTGTDLLALFHGRS